MQKRKCFENYNLVFTIKTISCNNNGCYFITFYYKIFNSILNIKDTKCINIINNMSDKRITAWSQHEIFYICVYVKLFN